MNETILQLIISAIVIGVLCLVVSHWFKSRRTPQHMKRFMFIIGVNISI